MLSFLCSSEDGGQGCSPKREDLGVVMVLVVGDIFDGCSGVPFQFEVEFVLEDVGGDRQLM